MVMGKNYQPKVLDSPGNDPYQLKSGLNKESLPLESEKDSY